MQRDMLGTMRALHQQYGDFYVVDAGIYRHYRISDPIAIYEVLVSQADKFEKDKDYKDPRKGLARFLGNGLLVSDGAFWKRQRRLAAPALHAQRIANYAQTMVDYSAQTVARWDDGQRLDISREMAGLTMQIVAKSLFNVDVGSEIERVARAMDTIQHFFTDAQNSLIPPWLPLPLPGEGKAREARRDLDALIYGIIADWRRASEDRGDLLSMLLLAVDEDGQGMTDEQARDELVTLFLAGHETTANSLNWTWVLLAEHPEVEARLHAELDSVLGGRLPTLADLPHLPYTEMVVKESMRLYPPAWGFSRVAVADAEINGYRITKGQTVGIMTYFTHHSPRLWDDPEAFRPERFSPENEPQIPRYAYLPFGGGPRVCIGNAFAMMEARLALATIAGRARLSLEPGQRVELDPLLTLIPKGGLPMKVTLREPVRETGALTQQPL